jgi:ABC-type branched-subunit amino acid transport system ATPase component
MEILRVERLFKAFNGVRAVDGLSFGVEKGSITALIGPNGSGKTVTLNLINGFYKPTAGGVYYEGKNITGLSPHKVFGLGIGRTFQNIRLFPQLTVMENVLLGLKYGKAEGLAAALFRRSGMMRMERENRERAMELLEAVGLEEKRDAPAESLSHGQRRLVEIARILATDSAFYLFDEPAAGVFPNMIPRIFKIIDGERAKGKTVLFIEHNMKVVMDFSDKIVVLNYGKKIAEGTPSEIQNDEAVLGAYMGKRGEVAS